MLHVQLTTVVFEIINFLILLAVLTHFFYRPVLRVMHSREEAISARLRDADEQVAQAKAERRRLAELAESAGAQADAVLAAAHTEAAAAHEQAITRARADAAALHEEAARSVAEQERLALSRTAVEVRATASTIAGQLIQEVAGPAVHEQLLERFLQSGNNGSSDVSAALQKLLAKNGLPLTIELAYPCTPTTEQRIRAFVLDCTAAGGTAEVTFKVEPALLAGMRLTAGAVVLDYSLAQSLRDLASSPAAIQSDAEKRHEPQPEG